MELTFAEIERLIGGYLPKAAGNPQWWSETGRGGRIPAQANAWGQAGYRAELKGRERVVFDRA